MLKEFSLNKPQIVSTLLNPKTQVDMWGRGTGKSNNIGWDVQQMYRYMPRGVFGIVGKTYMQLLTRTLPATISFLERIGIYRDVHFVIGHAPPKSWPRPFEEPANKYENFITFKNGLGASLLSQDRKGSSRGPSLQRIIADEALLLDKEMFDNEISPTVRGNKEFFSHLPFYCGYHFSTSMIYTQEAAWLMKMCDYYELEANIRIKDIWRRVVSMQLDLLEIENPKEFASLWNEIARIKQQMKPFVSKKGVLFTFANAFDNIENLGLSYIKNSYQSMTSLLFMIEIMNMIVDKIDDCYYNINPDKHIYYDKYDYSFIDSLDYDFDKLGNVDCRMDADCNKDQPLEISVDWGSKISFIHAHQENNLIEPDGSITFNSLKEFFVKPKQNSIMIDDLIDQFCNYYRFQNDKTVFYPKDKYGDEKKANSSNTYNEQAVERFNKNGWTVILVSYKGKEPPHHEKYLLWGNILKENNDKFPKYRINGNNCKYTIIAMNNTRVIEKDNEFKKDKSSEQSKSIPQEEATHSTDSVDKIIWVKFNSKTGTHRRGPSSFVAARF